MRTLLFIIFCLPILAFSQRMSSSDLNEALKIVCSEINKSTPFVVDEYTTLISAASFQNNLVYMYQLDASMFDDFEITKESWEVFQEIILKNSYCTDPDFKVIRDNNVKVKWKYSDILGRHISSITVNKYDCD